MKCRCPICDDIEGPFVKDPYNKDYVCLPCAESIQDTSESDWAEAELTEEDLANELFEMDDWF